MFTQTQIKKYLLSDTNKYIKQLSFKCENTLWIKDKQHYQYNKQQILKNNKKYEFKKHGKIFNIQTIRYLVLYHNTLFYYQDQKNMNYIGYCNLQNIYTQFLKIENNKSLLGLTNNKQRSIIFFQNNCFYDQIWCKLLDFRIIIQLNYYSKYYISDFIGEGSFANVYRVINKQTNQIFAAKVIYKIDNKGHQTKKVVLQQRNILSKITICQQVYRMYQFFQEVQKYIMIVDYASGEQLINIIKQKQNVLEKREVKYILKEILKGLEIIHFSKILHRDLKPQNIIVDILNKKVKIIDFGLALYTPKAQLKDFKRCGTMGYMAPQIVNNRGQHKKIYNQKCDIFSFGIIAHMLMVGRNPIKGKNYNETQFNNQHCNFKLEKIQIVKKYGQYGYKFLSACLEKQPEKRPSAFQLLNSKFLSSSSNSFSHSNVSQRINKDELLHKNQNRNSNQIQKQNIENCKYNLKYFDQNNHLKKQTFNHQNNDDDKDKDIDKYINIDMDIEIDIPLDKIQKPRHQSIIKKRTFFI